MRPRPCSRISVRPHRARAYRSDGLRARPSFCPMLAACVALGATACGRHVYLGSAGDGGGSGILWQATFETGRSVGVAGGRQRRHLHGQPGRRARPEPGPGAPRHYSGVATFAPMTVTSFSYLFREQPSPPEAYYGAWFFIPASVQVGSWLSLHHFGYHRTAGAPETTPLWDFNVYPGPDGNLIAHLYDSMAVANTDQTNPIPVPVARWVHFEIFYRKARGRDGAHHDLAGRRPDPRPRQRGDRSDGLGAVGRRRRVERHRAVTSDGILRRRDDQFDAHRYGTMTWRVARVAPTEGFGPAFPSVRNQIRCAHDQHFPRTRASARA